MLLESLEIRFEREQRLFGNGGIRSRRSQARYPALLFSDGPLRLLNKTTRFAKEIMIR